MNSFRPFDSLLAKKNYFIVYGLPEIPSQNHGNKFCIVEERNETILIRGSFSLKDNVVETVTVK